MRALASVCVALAEGDLAVTCGLSRPVLLEFVVSFACPNFLFLRMRVFALLRYHPFVRWNVLLSTGSPALQPLGSHSARSGSKSGAKRKVAHVAMS